MPDVGHWWPMHGNGEHLGSDAQRGAVVTAYGKADSGASQIWIYVKLMSSYHIGRCR